MGNSNKASLTEMLKKLRPDFCAIELKKLILPSATSLLDVGCGENSIAKIFRGRMAKTIGVEIFPEAIEKAKKLGTHDEYHIIDALDIDRLFMAGQIDCVLCRGTVEHLEKEKAFDLIKKMEKISKKVIIIETTNGFYPQGEFEGNPH